MIWAGYLPIGCDTIHLTVFVTSIDFEKTVHHEIENDLRHIAYCDTLLLNKIQFVFVKD